MISEAAAGHGSRRAGAPLHVAVLGAGTVGREVIAALLGAWPEDRFELTGVAVRNLERAREFGVPTDMLTDAPAHLVAGGPDVVVELMGGEEPARTVIAAALGAGLPVVTANKYVIARHGAELEAISRRTGAPLRYEAAVMGGTPVLRMLAQDLAVCRVLGFRGIVNGTSNYILTEMSANGTGYEAALAAAQAAGYAEADPTGDVEGGDAADKLVILARLAFGVWLDRESVAVRSGDGAPGITGVTAADLAAAWERGCMIRLLASARRAEGGAGAIEASVRATAIDTMSSLAFTTGIRNRVDIETDRLGWISLEGPGAGGHATAGAVLADLASISSGHGSTWAALPPAAPVVPVAPEPTEWFEAPSGARYPVAR